MKHIDTYLESLSQSLGAPAKPFGRHELMQAFGRGGVMGLTQLIRTRVFRGDAPRIFVAIHDTIPGSVRSYAVISIPVPMPRYGTPEFRNTVVRMRLRKTFATTASAETLAFYITHELCHPLLFALGHQYATVEKVVDLAAIYLGCLDCFHEARSYVHSFNNPEYLTDREGAYAVNAVRRRLACAT